MNQRRPRGRNNNNRGRHQNPRNQTFDSNGPEGRVRGSATQVLERYLAQARDAQAAGDGVLAENLFQHAEHYYRVLSAANAQAEQQQRERQAAYDERRGGQRNEGGDAQKPEAGEGAAESRESREGEAAEAAPEGEAQNEEAPRPRSRRRRSPERERPSAAKETGDEPAAEAEPNEEDAPREEIDAAFLKPAPKPRRRRPVAEAEAGD